ncbi:MAG TPA: hypothetical protein VLG40_01760 [Candidatus Saccharimonas sp.]|nr:hypothetical protein [Candidatus Saccharimonas sp.]
MKQSRSAGFVPISLVLSVVFGVLFVLATGAAIWAFVNYMDQKNNVDAKISDAVGVAKTAQQKVDQAAFTEQEKLPTRTIKAPDELGGLSLDYPKTWSVYLDQNGDNGNYEAYMYPLAVPSLQTAPPYALRVSVLQSSYESNVNFYQDLVKSGKLTATSVKINGTDALRLDGSFTNTINGSMLLVKIRDKTVRIATQSTTFQSDFDKIVVPSIKFNK